MASLSSIFGSDASLVNGEPTGYDDAMYPVHQAALNVCNESFAMLAAALSDLPGEALDWTPAPDTNSLVVLTRHSITSTQFWLACGSGPIPSLAEYRAGSRAPSFAAKGVDARQLQVEIAEAQATIESILAGGTAASLDNDVYWPDTDPAQRRTGVESLIHAIGHLREHVGQAQLMRDLWLARATRA